MSVSERAEEVFAEAIDIPPNDRGRFLAARCGNDAALHSEVRSLLDSHKEAMSFLEHPIGVEFSTSAGVPSIYGDRSDRTGQRVGVFTLRKLLGEGGCGVVYLAEQEHPVRRQVAVKIVRPGMQSKEMLARFDVERQALVLFDHPNIAKLFDAGATEDGLPYFAMEYVHGLPLTQHCEAHALATAARLRLFVLVCMAVQHAHQRGIIHRDLKPSNILVAAADEGDQPKVIDFGIAKSSDGRITDQTMVTQAGMPMGTLDYMSPEQISGQPGGVDARTDVYALGVILYELLTGVRPFELSSLSLADAQRQICDEQPVKASTRVARRGGEAGRTAAYRELRGDLDWIVLKAMDKDPARRYMSVSELAADVQRHLRDEPVEAGPPSHVYRLRKFVVRNRAISSAVVIVAAVLVAATIVSLMSARRAWRAESNAKDIADRSTRIAYRNGILAAVSNVERDPGVAKQALNEAPEALRDWEWHYLRARVDVAPSFYESDWPMSTLAGSEDGAFIAIGMHHGNILLWSQGTLEPRALTGHTKRIQALEFDAKGRRLASASSDGSVRLWDVQSGKSRVIGTHDTGVAAVSWDLQGERVASGGADGTVRVWSASDESREMFRFECGRRVYAVTFLGLQSETLAGGTEDGSIFVWNLADGSLSRMWRGAEHGIQALLPIHKEYELVAGSLGGSLIRWDARTGQNLHTYVNAKRPSIQSMAFSVDRTLIAVGDSEGDTQVWDRLTGKQTAVLPGQGQFVVGLTFLGNSAELVTATWGGMARFWQVGPGFAKRSIRPVAGAAARIAFGVDPAQVVAVTPKGYVGGWNIVSGTETFGHQLSAASAHAFDTSGRWLIRGHSTGEVERINAATGVQAAKFSAGSLVTVVAASADGAIIAGGCESGDVCLWEGDRGSPRYTYKGSAGCTGLAVCSDGQFAAAGFRDGRAVLFNLREPQVASVVGEWGVPIATVTFSPNGRCVAFGLQENSEATVRIVSTANRTSISTFGGTGFGVSSLAFSPSGQRLASGGTRSAVRVWSVADGQELMAIQDLDGNASALAFSADGRSLAAATTAGSIIVYGGTQAQWQWASGASTVKPPASNEPRH